ncbi:uroporphyrinogen-III C-methyltransferase [Aeribacillus composti]|uniref:uroporphyrinogen-III C-methyltransferase n=1 Tax=Aeribacillus composti TaxID=1868734 RepID=UPI002E21A107|nr:uroporphyrinogen-III C-methyltransferase [Aeribacillus composti]
MGKVYIVGAGPGDPELLTVKGLKCIQLADVILYDRLVNPVLLSEAKTGAKLVFCGKNPGCHSIHQREINQLLVQYAGKGKVVTRLKGGDPFIFGRGAEEAEFLKKHQIEFEIVPGITSGIAAPAYAGIPITHREYGSTVAFVPGHLSKERELNWVHISQMDTIVVYMGISRTQAIQNQLLKNGRLPQTPVAVIHNGTTSGQKTTICELENLTAVVEREKIKNPSIIVIGNVVHMHSSISWFGKLNGSPFVLN